ncbi:MAG TPA: C40 family peptidase [Ornithinibacter sp.]|nr:C40 family peptidase [Ornithinibacter sp.]
MLETATSGRHRGPSRYNPLSELSTIVKNAGQTSVKATAVLAASGGLVATFALPAQAEPLAAAPAAAEPARAPLARATGVAMAPAVVAPVVAAPAAAEVVGVVGVKAVAKPKPKPKPRPVVVAETTRSSSSSASRSSNSSTKSVTTKKATASNVPQSASGVVNIARGLLGIPYVYGGSTPAGFDCSGFTQYVFGKAGISLPRTASAQQRAATPVSNPQPGDLVFFGSPAWHVGIYTGNGMMIDSPREGKSTSERPLFSGVSGYGRF